MVYLGFYRCLVGSAPAAQPPINLLRTYDTSHESYSHCLSITHTSSDLALALANFQGDTGIVRLDGGLEPGAGILLLDDGVRTELVVGILQGLADGVEADMVAGLEEIRDGDVTTHGVEGRPLAVLVLREEVGGVRHGLRRVAGGRRGCRGGHRLRSTNA